MATGDYCTAAELKNRIWPPGTTQDTTDDTVLGMVITAVSKMIDNYCGRRFYTTTSDETRYFTTDDPEYLFPNVDIISITTLKTDEDGDRTYENTWATTDYDLCPANASLDSQPYTWIRLTPEGEYSFPKLPRSVQIVGKFGYCATDSEPAAVTEACLIQANRIFRRKEAPFGMVSNPVGGEVRLLNKLDPDIEMLLAGYRRVI